MNAGAGFEPALPQMTRLLLQGGFGPYIIPNACI
jgi:hypothetical protein